jgi:replicative DNA helicase
MSDNRVAPFSEEAEKAVIGSILQDGTAIMDQCAHARLAERSFYVPAHRMIYAAMDELYKAGRVIDLVTVSDGLRNAGRIDAIGGAQVLNRIYDDTPTAAHAGYYIAIVRDKQILRGVIETAREIEADAYEGGRKADEVLAQAPGKFDAIVEDVVREESNADVMDSLIEKWELAANGGPKAIGIKTPWERLNEIMCGLEVGMTIVAGRPSAGKTTMEDAMAQAAAVDGIGVYRATMDSSHESLLARAICRNSGVSLAKLKFGYAGRSNSNMEEVREARDFLAKLPIYIDTRSTDIAQIRSESRRMKMKRGVGLITVDYIQLVRAAEMGRSEWDTVARVTYVSRELKALSLELGIPIVVLSQLSRLVETENREPKLSDLRDSGAIEQDANKVIFVYVDAKKRKQMDDEEFGATKHKRPVWFNVMKHKDGETGAVPMWMYPPYFNFTPAREMEDGTAFVDDDLPSSRKHEAPPQKPSFAPSAAPAMPFERQKEFLGNDEEGDGD